MRNKKDNKLWWGYLIVTVFSLFLSQSTAVDYVNRQLMDQQFSILKKINPRLVPQDVVVIGIDAETIDRFPEPLALWHTHLNDLFTGLSKSNVRGVLLDIILPERSFNFLLEGVDRQLLTGLLQLKKNTTLVIARTIDDEGNMRPVFAPLLSLVGRDNSGLALVKYDDDGVVRRLSTALRTDKGEFDTLVGRMSSLLNIEAQEGYIDFALGDDFSYISMAKIDGWLKTENSIAMHDNFNHKIVLLGSVLPFIDRHKLPVPLLSSEPQERIVPGVFIHAQALRTILNNATIKKVNVWLTIAAIIIATLFWWMGQRFMVVVGCLAAFYIFLLGGSSMLLNSGHWFPIVGVLLAATIATLLRVSLESYDTWREKQFLKSSFSGYVSPAVLQNIVDHEMSPGLGGESRKVCVLFSDIRDFTTRSEGQSPKEVIDLLNRYFSEMTDSIHNHKGTVDKFIGDGLMAFFGAPNHLENPSKNAFSAAKDMLQRLKRINKNLADEGLDPLDIGIGLHFGDAIIGHVGSASRHEYTAIGDTVNIAARLEGVTKEVGYPIVCTQEVKAGLPDEFEELGETVIKGHSSILVFGWQNRLEDSILNSPSETKQ